MAAGRPTPGSAARSLVVGAVRALARRFMKGISAAAASGVGFASAAAPLTWTFALAYWSGRGAGGVPRVKADRGHSRRQLPIFRRQARERRDAGSPAATLQAEACAGIAPRSIVARIRVARADRAMIAGSARARSVADTANRQVVAVEPTAVSRTTASPAQMQSASHRTPRIRRHAIEGDGQPAVENRRRTGSQLERLAERSLAGLRGIAGAAGAQQ